MTAKQIHKLVLTALFTALCTAMTMVVQIPSPVGGYLNPGDCAVLLSGWILGPWYGAAAAGLGSMLADLLAFPLYAPATLLIKAGMAAVCGLIFRTMQKKEGAHALLPRLTSGAAATVILVGGYFLYESVILQLGLGAGLNIPANLVQGIFGIVSATAAASLLARNPSLSHI